jgi:hypothetical protein
MGVDCENGIVHSNLGVKLPCSFLGFLDRTVVERSDNLKLKVFVSKKAEKMLPDFPTTIPFPK